MHRYTITFVGQAGYSPNMNWLAAKVQNCLGQEVKRQGNSVYAEFLTMKSVEEAVQASADLIGHDSGDFQVTES